MKVFRPIRHLIFLLGISVVLSGCLGLGEKSGSSTGSVVAKMLFQLESSTGNGKPGINSQTIPSSVVTIRATITGPNMDFVSADFAVELHAGTLENVPAGDNRTLTLQGLDGSGNVIFEGSATGLTISPGVTTDTGEVILYPIDNTIPDPPTITVPVLNPVYTNYFPLILSGDCTTSADLSVSLSGAQTESTSCVSDVYSFSLSNPGSEGSFVYDVKQINTITNLTSEIATLTWVFDTVAPASVVISSPATSPITTSGSNLVFSGVCETGATVELTGDDVQSAVCLSSAFNFTVNKTVDGTYNFSLSQTDLAGNVSGPTNQVWTRDAALPALPTITSPVANPHYGNTVPLTLSGGCISSPAHTVNLGGNQAGSAPCVANAYSFTLTDPGVDGTYNYTVSQTKDDSGVASGTVAQTWVLDRVAPAVVNISAPSTSPVTTSGSALVVSGSCESGATVNLTGSDTQAANCTASAFSFTVNKTVDATYTFSLAQTDLAGNTSGPTAQQWVRDAAVPATPTITSPAANPHYGNTVPLTLSGGCTSATAHTVTLGGNQAGSVACAVNTYSFTLTDPGVDGTYNYTVSQTKDASGVSSATAGQTWVLDRVAPAAVTVSSPGSSPVTTSGNSLVISGACETASSVNLTGSDTQGTTCVSGGYSFTVNKTVDATYTFSLAQTDLAGNTSGSTPQVWVRDTALPATPTITSPAVNPHYGNTVPLTLSGGCTSATAHTVTLGGSQTGSAACVDSAYNFTLTDPGVDGTYNYTVSQTKDASGVSSGTAGQTWVLDRVAPSVVTVTSPATSPITTSLSSLVISGVCETNALVNLTGSDTQSTTCLVSGYSFTVNKTVDATYTFSLAQTDLAGNTSGSTPQVWVRDAAVPATPTITSPVTSPHYGNTVPLTLSGGCISSPAHTVTLGGNQAGSAPCVANAYSFSLTDPGDGTFNYTVLQTKDASGVSSLTAGQTWGLDRVAPAVVTITSPASSPVTTSGSALVVSGACETGTTVNMTGDSLQNTACVASGYSFTVNKTVDGTYTLTLSQTDLSGNASASVSQIWVRDTAVPATPTITSPAATPHYSNTVPLTLSGGCISSPAHTVTLGGNQAGSVACAVNTYSFTLVDPGLDGSFNYTVSQTKDASGVASVTAGQTWVLDTTAPNPVVISAPAASPITASGNNLVVSGSCETGATVYVTGDDIQNAVCSLSAFSFTINEAVSGTYNYSLNQTDLAGNTSTAVPQQWVQAPAVVNVNPVINLITSEAGGADVFNVSLGTQPNGNVVIDVLSLDTGEVTVNKAILTFTSGNWSTPQSVTVTGVDDVIVDGNQNVAISLTLNTGLTADTTGYSSLVLPSVAVANTDDEVVTVTVTPTTGLTTDETGTTTTFSVMLNTAPNANVVMDVASLDTSEVTVDKATLTFTTANRTTPQVVTVTGVDDFAIDGSMTATIALTMNGATADTTGYAALNPADVTVTNADDDAPSITVSPVSGLMTSEAGGMDSFTVALNAAPDGDVIFNVASTDTTEVTVDQSVLTFTTANWATPQMVTVSGVDDFVIDGNPVVTIALTTDTVNSTDTTGYIALTPANVTVTNSDDDTAGMTVIPTTGLITTEAGGTATFSVALNTVPDGDVVVDVTANDGTEISVDKTTLTFTTADWGTSQTVTVTGLNDAIVDGNQVVSVTLSLNAAGTLDTTGYDLVPSVNVAVTNSDNDVAGVTVNPNTGLMTSETGSTATFTVNLNTQPDGDVVLILISGNTAEATVDKASLTFTTADWATPQTVTLTGVADGVADGNQVVIISLLMDTILTLDTTGYAGINPQDATVTNNDNTPFVSVNPTTGLTTSEAGTNTTFSVFLNTAPDGDVVVDLASGNTAEVTLDKASLIFTTLDWATPQVVTLTGVNELVMDGDQVIAVSLTIDGVNTTDLTGYAALVPPNVSVTNQDDDTQAVTITPVSGLVTTESAGTATFNVSLSIPPNGDVAIDVVSGNTAEVSVNKPLLTFTTADWATPQTVTLTGVNDSLADGDIALLIGLTINGGATTDTSGFAVLTPGSVAVTNLDNESPSQGTAAAPADLTGSLPTEGTVSSTSSYYLITNLTGGASYNVSLSTVSNDLALFVYTDNTYATQLCAADAFGDARPESCIITAPANGQIVIRVDIVTATTGATFVVDVTGAPINEGTPGAPIDITAALPGYLGGFNGGASYYKVTGLIANTPYRVQLTNMTNNGDLDVYSDVNFTNLLCNASESSVAEACEAISSPTGELYIMVSNSTPPWKTFGAVVIDVLDPLTDEGTALAPIDLTNNLPYNGMIKTTASYYQVTGLIPGSAYTVELVNMAGQGALEVFSDDTFTTSLCVSDQGGNWPESCTVNANGSGILYIQGIPGNFFSTAGATYRVQVK